MSWLASSPRQSYFASLVVVLFAATAAQAVVVTANSDSATSVAPGDDPGWSNLAYLHNASAVYLGNRWMITANHVGDGDVRFTDGRTFDFAIGSGRQLTNAAGTSGTPDLRMFRLAQDPGLPALEIADTLPAVGEQVLLIGAGRDRGHGMVGWNFSNNNWQSVPLPVANQFGYMLESTSQMKWGTNEISAGSTVSSGTRIFTTRFDRFAHHFEAQAVSGDSGGAVFDQVDGDWVLLGIMISAQLANNQPANSVIFSNASQIGDLSRYRDQILEIVNRPDPAWQNQTNLYDVNRSGGVGPLDALLVINELQSSGAHTLTGTPTATDLLLDVSGDGSLGTTDALGIINALIAGNANASATASANGSAVPEPSTWALAIIAGVGAAAWRRVARRRQRKQPRR